MGFISQMSDSEREAYLANEKRYACPLATFNFLIGVIAQRELFGLYGLEDLIKNHDSKDADGNILYAVPKLGLDLSLTWNSRETRIQIIDGSDWWTIRRSAFDTFAWMDNGRGTSRRPTVERLTRWRLTL